MADEAIRDDKGRFVDGSVGNPDGRPKGSLNRYTQIKHLICDTLIARKDELKTLKLNDIVKFVAATSPKETKVEVNAPIIVRWETDADSNDGDTASPAS